MMADKQSKVSESKPKDTKTLTDDDAMKMIWELKLWAYDKWGGEMIDPHGPQVGKRVHVIPADEDDPEAEYHFTYSESDAARDYLLNPHLYKPRCLVELIGLVEYGVLPNQDAANPPKTTPIDGEIND